MASEPIWNKQRGTWYVQYWDGRWRQDRHEETARVEARDPRPARFRREPTLN